MQSNAGFKGKVASLKFTSKNGVPCSANRPVVVKVRACLPVPPSVTAMRNERTNERMNQRPPPGLHSHSLLHLSSSSLLSSPVHGAVQVPGPLRVPRGQEGLAEPNLTQCPAAAAAAAATVEGAATPIRLALLPRLCVVPCLPCVMKRGEYARPPLCDDESCFPFLLKCFCQ